MAAQLAAQSELKSVKGNALALAIPASYKHLADKVFGHATAGLFGYTHLTGGYPGGQAEYVRVPFADATHIKVPEGIPDEKLLFLGDIFPTGWMAADCLSTPLYGDEVMFGWQT